MAHTSPPSRKLEMAVCDLANPPDPSKFGIKRALSWIRGGYGNYFDPAAGHRPTGAYTATCPVYCLAPPFKKSHLAAYGPDLGACGCQGGRKPRDGILPLWCFSGAERLVNLKVTSLAGTAA